jgi:hypothetical protein
MVAEQAADLDMLMELNREMGEPGPSPARRGVSQQRIVAHSGW